MEFNRGNIIQALDCCIGGQDDKDCIVCPYDKHKYNCVICLMTDALALIKVEENEKLTINNNDYQKGFEDGIRAFADNIKKYYETLGSNTYGHLVAYTIDQKVKELLEGTGSDKREQRDDAEGNGNS